MRIGAWGFLMLAAAACGGSGSSNTNSGDTGAGLADAGTAGPTLVALTIDVTGNGAVNESGQSCRGHCVFQVLAGPLHLDAVADANWQATGFTPSGGCTATSCDLSISGPLSLAVAFQAANPVVDECHALLPAALPAPVVPDLACNGNCVSGTSDDGAGNFALLSETDVQFGSALWTAVQVRGGKVTLTKPLLASDQDLLTVFSQPSGFSMLDSGIDGNSLYTFSNAGVMTNDDGLGTSGVRVAPDPSGGFAAVVSRQNRTDNRITDYTFGRYDKTGALVAGDNSSTATAINGLSSISPSQTFSAGMTLSHHTLVVTQFNSTGTFYTGLWMDEHGSPVGSPFSFPGGTLQFLLDGTLLVRGNGLFTSIWADESAKPSPLPSWLQERAGASWLYPIRHGAGYAMGGTCAGIEVLTRIGKSCGCVGVPGTSNLTSIGRDGSLIVPLTDHYELYPLLFQ